MLCTFASLGKKRVSAYPGLRGFGERKYWEVSQCRCGSVLEENLHHKERCGPELVRHRERGCGRCKQAAREHIYKRQLREVPER